MSRSLPGDALRCPAARQQRLEAQAVPQHGDGRLSVRGSAEYGTSYQLEVNCTARGTPYRDSLRQTDPNTFPLANRSGGGRCRFGYILSPP